MSWTVQWCKEISWYNSLKFNSCQTKRFNFSDVILVQVTFSRTLIQTLNVLCTSFSMISLVFLFQNLKIIKICWKPGENYCHLCAKYLCYIKDHRLIDICNQELDIIGLKLITTKVSSYLLYAPFYCFSNSFLARILCLVSMKV